MKLTSKQPGAIIKGSVRLIHYVPRQHNSQDPLETAVNKPFKVT